MKGEIEIIPGINDLIDKINIDELKKIFFKRIYFSFFILEPTNKNSFNQNIINEDYIKNITLNLLNNLISEKINEKLDELWLVESL